MSSGSRNVSDERIKVKISEGYEQTIHTSSKSQNSSSWTLLHRGDRTGNGMVIHLDVKKRTYLILKRIQAAHRPVNRCLRSFVSKGLDDIYSVR